MAGDTSRPIIYQVENVRDGASFSTRLVYAIQKGENIFVALISYHKHEPSSAVHQLTMPDVKPPEELISYEQLIRHALTCVCHFVAVGLVIIIIIIIFFFFYPRYQGSRGIWKKN